MDMNRQMEPAPLRRLGTRRLARAHMVLGERPQVARLAKEALEQVCRELGQELGCTVEASARLLDTVVLPVTGLADTAAFALVELCSVGGTAVLELEPPLLFAVLERLSGVEQKPAPVTELTRLEGAAFAYLSLSVLHALRHGRELQRRFGPCLTGVTLSRSEALERMQAHQRHLCVGLEVKVGSVEAYGRLLLPAEVVESAVRELPVEPCLEIAPQVLAAELGVRCLVGRTPLSSESMEALGPGDVILFEELRRGEQGLEGPGRLVSRGFVLEGRFSPEGFALDRARRRALTQEWSMVMNEQSEGMPPLPVDVEVELARVMLSVSELAALKPGAVLPLHVNASGPVLLRVGDKAVARAELVDLEGEVGARIIHMLR
jgi:type III secretion protein Q